MRRLARPLLLVVVVVGALARLYRLTDRTFTHPEMFLPHMDVPEWATSPAAYDTLSELVTMVVRIDVHPPGFWMFMWAWIGVFGTELVWIRIPLVIAGIAAIVLTFHLGELDDGPVVGLVAAALVAVNGQHIFYSQIGRKYGFLVVFALLATILLRRVRQRGDPLSRIGYVAATACGLWFAHVFWFFLAGQLAWVLADGIRRDRFPTEISSPFAAAVAGSPGIFYVMQQWGRASYMEASPVPYLLELAMFGGLFDRQRLLEGDPHPAVALAVAVLTLAGLACLVHGIAVRWRAPDGWPLGWDAGDESVAGRADPLVALAVPVIFLAWNWTVVGRGTSQLATLGIALAAAALPRVVRGVWPLTSRLRSPPPLDRLVEDPLAFLLLAVGGGMSFVSVVAAPLAATRTMLFLGPFVAIVSARGLVGLGSTRRRAIAVGASLALVGTLAVQQTELRPDAHDHKTLAERMEPRLRADDLVVLRNAWWSQPMHYHLPSGQPRATPEALLRNMERDGSASRPERIWLLAFGDEPYLDRRTRELVQILEGYRRVATVEARDARALLFERTE